jgi:hypothetical protein
MMQPLAGGPPHQLMKCVWPGSVVVGPAGIYYVPCLGGKPLEQDAPLRVMDPVTANTASSGGWNGSSTTLHTLPSHPTAGRCFTLGPSAVALT